MSTSEPNIDLELQELEQEQATPPAPEPDLEEEDPRYTGKSKEDVIRMHKEAEKKLSHQGFELGDLRRNVDTLLGLRKEKEENSRKQREPITADALLNNPDQALETAINTSEVAANVQTANDKIDDLEKRIGRSTFESKFPTFENDVQNDEFQKWVRANRARTALLVSLDKNFDFDSGVALWEMWEEHKALAAPKETPETPVREVKKGKVVKNGTNERTGRKPMLSRAKLQELQIRAERGDPLARAKWNDPGFQEERLAAYADGRVK